MSKMVPVFEPVQHQALFLSDLHLGALGARADLVLEFLMENRADSYWMVGDIYDLNPRFDRNWTAAAQAVVNHLRQRHADGARLVYVRGNHDPDIAHLPAERRLPVEALDHGVHLGGDGQTYLVVHGDSEDTRLFKNPTLTRLGSLADQALRGFDWVIRRHLHDPAPCRRSVVERLLSTINTCFYPLRAHEARLAARARDGAYDGVICGHFHLPALHGRKGVTYANCGDWLDSFTAIAAAHDGTLSLLGGRAAFSRSAAAGRSPGLVRA